MPAWWITLLAGFGAITVIPGIVSTGFIAKPMGGRIVRAITAGWLIRSALLLGRIYLALAARMMEQTALQAD